MRLGFFYFAITFDILTVTVGLYALFIFSIKKMIIELHGK